MVLIEKKITNYDSLSFKKYLNEIGKYPLLTFEEEIELAEKIKQGDKQAFNKLVNCNLRFVVSVAKQYVNKRAKLEDLVNEGNMGLIKGVYRFDPTRGFKLITSAVWWIRQQIGSYLDDNSDYFRIPSGKVKAGQAVKEARITLTQVFEREPTNSEIIEYIGDRFPKSSLEIVFRTQGTTVKSIETPITDDGITLGDSIPSDINPTDYLVENTKSVGAVKSVLSCLTERERFVIINVYGLFGNDELTMDQVGERLGLTGSRVQQINAKVIQKLKNKADNGLFEQIFK